MILRFKKYNQSLIRYFRSFVLISGKLDSMRWFSHRRNPSPPGGTQWYRLVLRAAYGTRPTMHCQWDDSAVFRFCPWWPWPLTFDLDLRNRARFLYNVPNGKFDHPMFSRSEVIVRTNILTNK